MVYILLGQISLGIAWLFSDVDSEWTPLIGLIALPGIGGTLLYIMHYGRFDQSKRFWGLGFFASWHWIT